MTARAHGTTHGYVHACTGGWCASAWWNLNPGGRRRWWPRAERRPVSYFNLHHHAIVALFVSPIALSCSIFPFVCVFNTCVLSGFWAFLSYFVRFWRSLFRRLRVFARSLLFVCVCLILAFLSRFHVFLSHFCWRFWRFWFARVRFLA